MKNILQNLPTTFIFLTIFSSSITAFPNFFPNISSIPPSFLPNITTNPWDSFNKLSGCHSGQNLSGISKLKNYFHYFGYIGNKTTNFTDEFDDSLESAVKNYQINFNLNVTGELDQSTVTQILKPRCGVADIVNGFSTMNSGKSESITGNTVRHYSFFPGRSRWPTSRRDLTYAFDPRNQLSVEVKSVFAKAFMRWSEWTPLTFREIRNYNTADIKIGFYDGDHGDGEEFDGVLGTLAHAFEPPSGLLHLDNAETWIIGDVNTFISPSAMHLESVAVHEIGHLLGLGHSSKEVAIMYPTISSNLRRVELDQDDIQGIQMLYGSKPDNNGSKPDNNGTTIGPSFNESDISGAYHGVSMKVYIVLLVFIFFIL